jgi:uroporphyrinogen decarboxylase
MHSVHQHLVEQGMPDWVDGNYSLDSYNGSDTWQRYWGTLIPIDATFTPMQTPLDFSLPAIPNKRGIKKNSRIEGEFEIIESETGAVTRQVVDNSVTYSMPEFLAYDVRDRASWNFFRDRATPDRRWSEEQIQSHCAQYLHRDRPLCLKVGSTWGTVRDLMGPERGCMILYDDPELAREIIEWEAWLRKEYLFPIIERLRPEIICCHEDNCYKQGMMISPDHFVEFCSPYYRQISQVAKDCGCEMVAMDSDGNISQLVKLAAECGINALYPCEVKADNNLFEIKKQHPDFIFFGWLEKECLNAGNENLIEKEILTKVPAMLAQGRYFPNCDHGIQPFVSFDNMRKFMTLLHEVTGNPEGEYEKVPEILQSVGAL